MRGSERNVRQIRSKSWSTSLKTWSINESVCRIMRYYFSAESKSWSSSFKWKQPRLPVTLSWKRVYRASQLSLDYALFSNRSSGSNCSRKRIQARRLSASDPRIKEKGWKGQKEKGRKREKSWFPVM